MEDFNKTYKGLQDKLNVSNMPVDKNGDKSFDVERMILEINDVIVRLMGCSNNIGIYYYVDNLETVSKAIDEYITTKFPEITAYTIPNPNKDYSIPDNKKYGPPFIKYKLPSGGPTITILNREL